MEIPAAIVAVEFRHQCRQRMLLQTSALIVFMKKTQERGGIPFRRSGKGFLCADENSVGQSA